MIGVLATLLATTTVAHGINWNGNWAASCDFIGNDFKNSLSTVEDCAGRCASTTGCTHYTWTIYNGGTCWMKNNSVSKHNAVPKYDQGAVCGFIVGSVDRAITGAVGGVVSDAVGGLVSDALGGVVSDAVGGVVTGAVGVTNVDSVGGIIAGNVSAVGAVATGDLGGAIVVDSIGGAFTGNVSGVIASAINWNGKNWAFSCNFVGNDLTNALTTAKDCGGRCSSTTGCTHYTWTNYNGGTCWMKTNSVSKSDAVPKYDGGAVCGITVRSVVGAVAGAVGGVTTGTIGGVIESAINWNGKNWAASCHFIGNDLANALTKGKDCSGRCNATPGCTHYTWTNYNGGTCWMKKNSVAKSDAVPKYDQGAVCGVIVHNVGGSIAGAVGGGVTTGVTGGAIGSTINWNGKNWATSCHFIGNDLANALTKGKDCEGRCNATPGCTHYTWTNYNGGTCWMKKNSVSKSKAVPRNEQGAVCGIAVSSAGGVTTGITGGVIESTINWNGRNWAASCHFIGNDLANALTTAKDCGMRCSSTPGCTHYSWTNYNGGTCWMKKNSVSKSDAVPRNEQGAVCGVTIGNTGEITAGSIGEVVASGINWNGNNWVASCDSFDLAKVLTTAEDCGKRCLSTPGCTHYTWTNYNGGTCWMKRNLESKINEVSKYDQGLSLLIDYFRKSMSHNNRVIINLN